jgi:uncharacterized protein YndB with AHSA1/START domain
MTTNPTATKKASTFRMECSIAISISAAPERIWALLTDAAKFPSWNSTVTSIDGTIAKGEKLALRVPAAPKRVFKPKVVAFEPAARMVWSDGMAPMFKGVRTYQLTPRGDGTTEFAMTEVLSGLMLPLAKKSLPDFGPTFETYAADLKRAAERGGK